MAFGNAFQKGQQFQSLQDQRAQNLVAGEQNILVQQQQNQRADKSFAAREDQRGKDNARRATSDERLAAADQTAKADRDRDNQLRATQNTVKFIKAGIGSGKPIEQILQDAAQPLQALGVTPDQFGALAQQIQQDPGVLDQFTAALSQAQGPRRAIGRPTPVRFADGKTGFLQTFSDGSSEAVEGATPLAEELGQGRLDVQRERIDPTAAGELAGVKAEEKTVGTARGEIRAGDLARGKRETKRAERAVASRKQRSDLVNKTIDEVIDEADIFSVGPGGSVLKFIPGTDASDLEATLETIRANVGFDELQRLRDNSPTGGALGQISERENVLLQSVLGSISQAQSPSQFRKRLRELKEQFKLSQERIAEAFEDDFGVPYEGPGTAIPTSATGLEGMSDADLAAAIAAGQGAQ